MALRNGRIVIFIYIAILAFLAFLIFFSGNAGAKSKSNDVAPLYVDESGWEIVKVVPGYEVVKTYDAYRPMHALLNTSPVANVPAYIKYIYENEPDFFCVLALSIPDNVVTFWTDKTVLTLSYLHKKDTLRVESMECFFFRKPNDLYFTWQMSNPYSVPNAMLKRYPSGNYAVYVKFPFEEVPDRFLSCSVSGVRSYQKEVSKR